MRRRVADDGMQAMTIEEFGGLDVLNAREVPAPKVRPGCVLVKVEAVGVNYYDTLIRSGAVSRDIALPHVGGSDVVGVIEANGEGVTEFTPGQKVIVAPGYPTDVSEQAHRPENEARSYFPTGTFEWGGYAQFMEVSARWVLPDDTGLPPEELAAIPLVLVTAVHAVRSVANVGPGQRVLVQAGASGVGSMAIQIAKALGAEVIATVSTEAKAKLACRFGSDAVVNYRAGSVADEVLALTSGEGVDVVIDPVGGITLPDNIGSLRPRGTIVNLGYRAAWRRQFRISTNSFATSCASSAPGWAAWTSCASVSNWYAKARSGRRSTGFSRSPPRARLTGSLRKAA